MATRGWWGWPATCGTVSSPFGYRWGSFHDGTDISGCGYGSNIFAAQAGTVEVSAKKPGYYAGGYGDNGEYIVINHHNGFYTLYAHLCPGCRAVKAGDYVEKGQVIGGMGMTGAATGVHLHLALLDCHLFNPSDNRCHDLNSWFRYSNVRINQNYYGLGVQMYDPHEWGKR